MINEYSQTFTNFEEKLEEMKTQSYIKNTRTISEAILEEFLDNHKDYQTKKSTAPNKFIPIGYGYGYLSNDSEDTKQKRTAVNWNRIDNILGLDFSRNPQQIEDAYGVDAFFIPSSSVLITGSSSSGKTTLLRNITDYCLTQISEWLVFVGSYSNEFAMYRNYGVPLATTVEDMASVTKHIKDVMLDRYEELAKRSLIHWDEMPEKTQSIMLLIDNIEEFLPQKKLLNPHSDLQYEFEDAYAKQDILQNLEQIVRLGSGVNVFVIITSSRPDNEIFTSQLRGNITTKIGLGYLDPALSQMVFSSKDGTTIKSYPKGELMLQVNEFTKNFATIFNLSNNWLENYCKVNNLKISYQQEYAFGYHEDYYSVYSYYNDNDFKMPPIIYNTDKFDASQIEVIKAGIAANLDISIYAKPEFNCHQMDEIFKGMKDGVNVELYAKPEFNERQMEEIHTALLDNMNITDIWLFAKPEFNGDQMAQIKAGIKDNVKVHLYANPAIPAGIMKQIRESL